MRTLTVDRIAAQLYTVRDHCKVPADIADTLHRIRAMGYRSVQASALGPVEPKELRRMLEGEGLVCCAAHEPPESVLTEPERIADKMQAMGCPHIAYSYPAGRDVSNADGVKSLCAALNKAGRVYAKSGIGFSYHNHAVEFQRVGKKTVLEWIYEKTDPKLLSSELDTYWVQAGGGDPVEWVKRLKGRLPLLHLKDYGVDAQSKPRMEEIGYGNLDWARMVPAALQSGCGWFIVEQDRDWEAEDPFRSLKMSFDYLKRTFAKPSA
jgi:sugar phosphate isomerase/epimerase